MNAEILLTLKLNEQLFADPRRILLLRHIQQTGSISQGAKLSQISYKTAWDAINAMNRLSPQRIVQPATGGKGGGGAQITAYGERLLQLYDLLAKIQQKALTVLQDDTLPLDSLLGAIARFSLQTSARNQLFAQVTHCIDDGTYTTVYLQLHDKTTTVTARITEQSAKRLQLETGKEVLALIKAPWVKVTKTPPQLTDNLLAGTLLSLTQHAQDTEMQIGLPNGTLISATQPSSTIESQNLRLNEAVIASFSAESIIIATLC